MSLQSSQFGNSIKKSNVRIPYSSAYVEVPVMNSEITARENFKLSAARKNPLWVPVSLTDFQSIGAQDVVTKDVRGMQAHTDFRRRVTEDYTFTDWFNTNWTWVCTAGGAMLTPGTVLLDDITNWEEVIKFPDLSEWDFEETAANYMRTEYTPDKVMHFDIGRGCTERLISILGGYSEGLLAMAMEPEAVSDFLERFADFEIELFDKINSLYPLDMVTYHDDWGTERETFFSEKMLESMIFNPTKRIIDHIKSKGVLFELHSCGNITRFLPYMIDLGADFLQIQRRAVNIPEQKHKYGDKIGFNTGLEGFDPSKQYTDDELVQLIHRTVDIYGADGGFYASIFSSDKNQLWKILTELWAYSQNFYNSTRR